LAGLIPESIIEDVRRAADIVEIVSEVVALKPAGRNLVGLCPFHNEKTPSFTVSPEKQIFHCFGCGQGGNVFAFLMQHQGMSFPEAVRALAERYRIPIPETAGDRGQGAGADLRSRLQAVNSLALDFYRRSLAHPGEGRPARDYLERRGLSAAVIEAFQLGYAPPGWDHLARFLKQRRVPEALAEKAGLIAPRRSGSGFYDRFRSRIIFPIFDLGGKVAGFGGRVLDDGLPKYLNSPETPLYNKRRCLYGLYQARDHCRAHKAVYIVEGYLDLLALHQRGLANAVATLGTALTAEQVALLKRFIGSGDIILVFDGDAAGQKAAERTRPIFEQLHSRFQPGSFQREKGVNTRVLELPEGHDPDTFLREHGPEAFTALAATAKGMVAFLIDAALRQHGDTIEGRASAVGELIGPLQAVGDPVTRSLYVKLLAEKVGVDEAAIVRRLARPAFRPAAAPAGPSPSGGAAPVRLPAIERQLTAMMLQYPDALADIDNRRLTSYFQNFELKTVAEAALARYRESGTVDGVIERLADSRLQRLAAALAMGDEQWTPSGCRQLIAQFERARSRPSREMLDAIARAEQTDDEARWRRLLQERQQAVCQRELARRKLLNH
jgi:DNA primase